MKSLLAVFTVFLLFTGSQFAAAQRASVADGPGGSGGGSGPEVEFIQIAKHLEQILGLVPERFPLVPVHQMWRVYHINTKDDLQTYKLSILPRLMKDGEEKDALNYPKQDLIELSSARWDLMSQERKYIVVLHELLGLMEVDDAGYKLSNEIGKVLRDLPKVVAIARHREPDIRKYKMTGYWGKLADRVALGLISAPARFKVIKFEECREVDVYDIEDACEHTVEVLDSRFEFYNSGNKSPSSRITLFTRDGFEHKKGEILHGWAYRIEGNLNPQKAGQVLFSDFEKLKSHTHEYCANAAERLCSVNLGEKTRRCQKTALDLCLGK